MSEPIKINDKIMRFNPRETPLLGYWKYSTWWSRLGGFFKTGAWPKREYVKGMMDFSDKVHVVIDKTGEISKAWVDEQ